MTSEPTRTEATEAGDDGPVSQTLARVSRLHRLFGGRLLRPTGLCSGQEFLMMTLWKEGSVRQSELAKALDLDPSTVTLMLRRLEQGGHVVRTRDPQDRRVMLVRASAESYVLRPEVAQVWAHLEEHTLDGLDDEEREAFARILSKIEKNLTSADDG
ncbi:MarR family winged helix-turn-helix transcriptional regulator [Streptomyces rapamycinicus]|uniref:MarR family transcriptional regulator n=2 Tax=Streptomyces rapamycinicus TaxID=1226757 RepID=A0A0A0NCU0_STRRN|nr:MarR family transcriptional regulator [Streptomyces rapamycinicus]AGP52265.1 MarR family transcriptional regulator [Streptomyces rapamycinicus NRRL 5491]MBB4779724.1 DNA-binding MarR family transcriptional regulator [Streptomyces rapamycinicus]RLV75616.1 MarR family transcriptional regulator [Streptomyces rapamycinicus NRRL 5491]UTP28457.1 MarR family transcriptional regulator [Streptomyces rapamycinicus NRRL 5491]